MELMPFQVTQFPALLRSCKASGKESDFEAIDVSVVMKTKRVCRSTRASWIALSRPDSGSGSGETGTKTTARLCSTQSSTASAIAANNQISECKSTHEFLSIFK